MLTTCNLVAGGSDSKESAYNVGDPGSIPGWGRPPGEGNGNTLQDVWKIPWTEEPGRLQSMGSQEPDTTEQLTHTVVNIQTLIYTLLFTLLLKLFGVPENKALSCVLNKSTFLYYNNIAPGRAPCVTAVSH